MDSFSEKLRLQAQPIWRAEIEHPFVRGLADGTLPIERFRFYLCQDYIFLIEYCRVFALAAAKARDLESIAVFAKLLDDTLQTEMELHREYCRQLGVARDELEHTQPAPITHGYTRHLLQVAWSGSLAEIVAAILPCQLGYAEISTTLAAGNDQWRSSPYAEWIRSYSSEEFVESAERIRAILDQMVAGWVERDLVPLRAHFLTSSRYEYLFWEMSWRQEQWPL